MKTLFCMLVGAGIAVGLVAAIALLRFITWPLMRLIGAYWDWCNDNIHNEFYSILLSMLPLLVVLFAFMGWVFCRVGFPL
jgi:hypothetical protein